jgi:flavin-dependent dehydrogenase
MLAVGRMHGRQSAMADRRAARGAEYDVVVVGGRVAGSLTAALLAKAGLHVLVVDRARFPSPTPSTHFFRGDGLVRVMSEVGVLAQALAFGSPRLTCQYSYLDGAAAGEKEPPQDPGAAGYCLSVRREPLDATLLAFAAGQGAHVETSVAALGVLFDGERVGGVELADGRSIRAKLVVGADGRRSMVARAVGAADRERHDGKRALYYRYVEQMPGPNGDPDGAEFSLLGDELAYVFPSDHGLTCVAISVNLEEYERIRHDAVGRFDQLLRRHRGIWDRYERSPKASRLLGTGPQPDFVRQPAGAGWALVGDATVHQDPWSGLGMDSAGVSAAVLAEYVVSAGDAVVGASWADAYERARDAFVLDGFHETVAAAGDLSAIG